MTRPRLVFGLVFIALGTVLLLDQVGVVSAWGLLAEWWPMVLVLIGAAQVVIRPRNPVGGTIVGVLGGVLLLGTLGIVETVALLWPLVLIGSGIWLVARRGGAQSGWEELGREILVWFDDRQVVAPAGRWTGQAVTAVFGDVRLDLRRTTIEREASLQVTTVFGDVEIEVPARWRITVSGPQLFGDVRVEPPADPTADAPVLRLQVMTVLGDLRVRRDVGVAV